MSIPPPCAIAQYEIGSLLRCVDPLCYKLHSKPSTEFKRGGIPLLDAAEPRFTKFLEVNSGLVIHVSATLSALRLSWTLAIFV